MMDGSVAGVVCLENTSGPGIWRLYTPCRPKPRLPHSEPDLVSPVCMLLICWGPQTVQAADESSGARRESPARTWQLAWGQSSRLNVKFKPRFEVLDGWRGRGAVWGPGLEVGGVTAFPAFADAPVPSRVLELCFPVDLLENRVRDASSFGIFQSFRHKSQSIPPNSISGVNRSQE